MFKTIIVGTDGTQTAHRAVTKAIDLALLSGAELHIASADNDTISSAVGAFVPSSGDLDPEQVTEELVGTVDTAAEEARAKGAAVTTHAMRGDATEALCGLANEGRPAVLPGQRAERRFPSGALQRFDCRYDRPVVNGIQPGDCPAETPLTCPLIRLLLPRSVIPVADPMFVPRPNADMELSF